MFLVRRPSPQTIDRVLRDSQDLPLSYGPVGIVLPDKSHVPDSKSQTNWNYDELTVVVGRGRADYDKARDALLSWTHFDLGWVDLFPRRAPVAVGTVVAVQIRHMGLWSLNGCRIVYIVGSPTEGDRFGFAYGTLTNHAEAGEELFEVFVDPRTEEIRYRIRATSRPRAALAWLGQPVVRLLQSRFRRDSSLRLASLAQGRP
jgi:uncharacterized protein (UPF0548 family)